MGDELAAKAPEPVTSAPGANGQLFVLKHDDLFAVFNARGDFHGDLHAVGPSLGADGLFQDDTRILSKLILRFQGKSPELLSANIGYDNVVFTAHLANPVFRDRLNKLI